ncbi:GDSL-type esterase/lipase family protein [Cystobacter fuscus]|uniref:SGNH/GDSL hydrolase family protein n=1 Tax=Cystobacter fuscus TaxID=43 RepID=UPI002B2C7144|nr:SGNH/GDSL hydrolase family protein [Cystobacter fuscus]
MILARWLWLPLVLGMAGCEPFDPWYDFPANDNRLQFIGRMDFTTPDGPTYAHPGTTIRFRCDCTGVDVSFEDKGKGGDEHTNFVNILVDGEQAARVELRPEAGMLRGARALPPGEHVIEIVKRTESYAGNIRFLGVSVQGSLLEPPPRPERRMEFIGDSITCGYGNEVRIFAPTYTEPNTGYHSKNEDISKAYGSLLGRKYNAEVITTCISGMGVYRNLNGATGDKAFPNLYRRIYPGQDKPLWDTKLFVPEVIVINLGNNDFNVRDETKTPSAPPAKPFQQAYKAFVQQLRGYYPDAKIVCSIGPLMNDNYPVGRKHWTLIQKFVSEMVDSLREEGDSKVYYFAYTPVMTDPYGEDWHPTAEVHAAMAKELGAFLDANVL